MQIICNYPDFESSINIVTDSLFSKICLDQKIRRQYCLNFPYQKTKEPHLDLEIKTEFPISEFDPSKLKLELISEKRNILKQILKLEKRTA